MSETTYNSPVKTSERWRAWEALADATPLHLRREGWVIALAGRRFLDRKVARRFGFNNVIGVDVCEDVVKHNAKHGRTVLHMPLDAALSVWPESRPIAVVVADFTSSFANGDVQSTLRRWLVMRSCSHASLFLNVSTGLETKEGYDLLLQKRPGPLSRGVHRSTAALEVALSLLARMIWPENALNESVVIRATDLATVRSGSYKQKKKGMRMDWLVSRPIPLVAARLKPSGSAAESRHIAAKMAWHTRRTAA